MPKPPSTRNRITGCSPYEGRIGFSRAVRVGDHIFVSGTAPIDPDGGTSCRGDAYGQTMRCIEIIAEALVQAGSRLDDVVRVRMYITDRRYFEQVCEAYKEAFADIAPAATMTAARLLEEDWLVELEVDAMAGSGG